MYHLLIRLFIFTLFASLAVGQESGEGFMMQRLLQRYTETYGGLRDANRLASISMEGVQVQSGVEYKFHVHKKRPASIRYQLESGNASLTAVSNGQQGWLQTKQGTEVQTEELFGADLEMLKKEAHFESPLYRHLEKPENRINLEGREVVEDVQTYILRVEEEDSATSLYYLHPENSHVLRIDQLNKEGDVVLQTFYRDYKEVGGYPFAHEVENRIDGEIVSLTRINSIVVNPGLLSFYFENPGE